MLAIIEQAIAWMHHFQPKLARPHRAIGAQACTHRELGDLLRTEMEETQHQGAAGVVRHRHPQQRPIPEAAFHRLHPALHLGREARL